MYVPTHPAPWQQHAVVTFISLRIYPKKKEPPLTINKEKWNKTFWCSFQPLGRPVRRRISETIRVLTDVDAWIVEPLGLLSCFVVQFVDRLFQDSCNMEQLPSTNSTWSEAADAFCSVLRKCTREKNDLFSFMWTFLDIRSFQDNHSLLRRQKIFWLQAIT